MSQSRSMSWRIALPTLVVLVLVAGWCVYWWVARQMAQREFAGLADNGVRIDCAAEQWVGFPFRLTLICDSPSFTLDRGNVAVSGSGSRLSATARIYAPSHVIVELAGPSTLTQTRPPDPDGRIPDQVTVRSANAPIRAGLQLGLDGVRRVTARLDGWSGSLAAQVRGRDAGSMQVVTGAFGVHWSRDSDAPRTQSLALDTRDLTISGPVLKPLGQDRVTVARGELAATATRLPQGRGKGIPDMLRDWQAAGGELRLNHLAIDTADRHAAGSGTIRLDADGRLDGTVDLTVKDLERVFDELMASGRIKSSQAVLAATALSLLAKGAPPPEPGWSRVPVRLSRGRFYIGPFKAAEIPPLF